MKVLLVNKFWKPLGGVEVHAKLLQAELTELGHEVVPFAMADPDNWPAEHADLFVRPVDFREGRLPDRIRAVGRATAGIQTVRRLRQLLEREDFDVAHVLHPYHQLGTTFLELLARRNVPIVLGLHDYKIGCPSYRLFSDRTGTICTRCLDHRGSKYWAPVVERCWSGSRVAGASLVAEAAVSQGLGMYRRNVDIVLVLNEMQRRCVAAAGISDDRVRELPHYVEDRVPVLDGRDDTYLYVGRLVPEKGVDTLIRAAAGAGARLRLVGDGRDREDLERLADEVGCEATFVGAIAPGDVQAEMSRARALIVPSVWHEVLPLVVFEAFAIGLPVIGSDVGGVSDLLAGGRGVLVPPGDVGALAAVLARGGTDPGELVAKAAVASSYASETFTQHRFRQRLLAAYDDARRSRAARC